MSLPRERTVPSGNLSQPTVPSQVHQPPAEADFVQRLLPLLPGKHAADVQSPGGSETSCSLTLTDDYGKSQQGNWFLLWIIDHRAY